MNLMLSSGRMWPQVVAKPIGFVSAIEKRSLRFKIGSKGLSQATWEGQYQICMQDEFWQNLQRCSVRCMNDRCMLCMKFSSDTVTVLPVLPCVPIWICN
jgi:hypothetical protein